MGSTSSTGARAAPSTMSAAANTSTASPGLWVVNAGHGRAEIAEAMGQQAARLAYASSMSFTTVPAVQLAAMIAELTPGDLNRVFFCSGGSEAVESAIKIAKQVQAMRGFPRRYKIIARRGSYHGMTYGAMSLTRDAERERTSARSCTA